MLFGQPKPGNTAKTHADETNKQQFSLLDLLIDTEDPVQTVENFFDFAFLIKVRNHTFLFLHIISSAIFR